MNAAPHTFEIPEPEAQKLEELKPQLPNPTPIQRADFFVRDRPWCAGMIAMVTGFALGWALTSR